ncbi:hypothetical protein ACH40F_08340 [Streptomyces sp. NPDC020794]|uniref:hypothetical protein n=1 Tax=unclassified Streptomyces TaxID=2593676 RepID=UPI0036E16C94
MSAPTTRDPLAVNTVDGASWVRRAVTSGGRGLYAVEGSCRCPEYLMATYAELEEHGIAGLADALPMPGGSEPSVAADQAKAPWGRGEDGRPLLPMGAHWTDVPELVDQYLAGIKARVDQAQSGHWYVSPIAERPDTVCTRVDGYHRTVGRFANVLPADLELVLHAHDDLSWCLDMVAKLRGRVAELEAQREADHETWQHDLRTARTEREAATARIAELLAERHVTNEALSDAAEALRANQDRVTETEARRAALTERMRAGQRWQRGRNPELVSENLVSQSELRSIFGIPLVAPWAEAAAVCRCDEPGADPYSCEADDCSGHFSELNPFGGARPVNEPSAEVSRTCGCGWRTTVWHVDDGSAEEELHDHVTRVHGGTALNHVPRDLAEPGGAK